MSLPPRTLITYLSSGVASTREWASDNGAAGCDETLGERVQSV